MKKIISSQQKRNGFTIVELIVAISILAIITTIGTMTFTESLKSSRDAKRKADLEQLKTALELYRSNNPSSVYPSTIASVTQYINIPKEVKNNQNYGYLYLNGNDYNLGARLEKTAPTCVPPGPTCYELKTGGLATSCNYCMGPYGKR